MERQHNHQHTLMPSRRWGLIALMIISITLSGCMPIVHPSEGMMSESGERSLTRVRLSEVIAWQMLDGGQLQVSLNSPQRTYRLALKPSCTFALREAVDFEFSGQSSDYITLGDDVVVGRQRCRISGIFVDDGAPKFRVGAEQR